MRDHVINVYTTQFSSFSVNLTKPQLTKLNNSKLRLVNYWFCSTMDWSTILNTQTLTSQVSAANRVQNQNSYY